MHPQAGGLIEGEANRSSKCWPRLVSGISLSHGWQTALVTISTLVAASPALPAFGGDVRLGFTTSARGIQTAKRSKSHLHPAGRTCPEDFSLPFAFSWGLFLINNPEPCCNFLG